MELLQDRIVCRHVLIGIKTLALNKVELLDMSQSPHGNTQYKTTRKPIALPRSPRRSDPWLYGSSSTVGLNYGILRISTMAEVGH